MAETPQEKKSKAERLAEHIRTQLDANVDLSTLEGRKKDFQEFIDKNKDETFTKSHYLDILKRELKRKNIDAKAYGLKSKTPTFSNKKIDMKMKISPHPAQVKKKSEPTQPSVSPEIAKPTVEVATQEEIKQTVEGIRMHYTEQNVAITMKALYNILKLKYPDIESLTDEEKEILGELWLPAFQKYLAENYAILVIPTIATLALVSPKINDAKKKQIKKTPELIDKEIKKLEAVKKKLEEKKD